MGGYFSWDVYPGRTIFFINGSNHVLCGILQLVVCLAAEVELAALFLNMREAKILRLMLGEMSNEQH